MGDSLTHIWKRVLTGDVNAWQELVASYASLVYTVAKRTGLNDQDAEDCAQYSWVALYRKRQSIRDPQAIPAWLIRTTRRRAAQLLRQLAADLPSQSDTPIIDESPSPETLSERGQLDELVRSALTELDPRCKTLIEQLYFSDQKLSYQRIAEDLGLKANSLGALRQRCLVKLREILRKKGLEMN
ncbi:MAG TPA: sigma-70 family RNA polymerase sigma factor [candidate division Zixibacteria bacterium]|nr:sigma-70 family RNA polymerase sigma factor [candidate division Zixibacteria bacterium]